MKRLTGPWQLKIISKFGGTDSLIVVLIDSRH